jgi:hypothetical protein
VLVGLFCVRKVRGKGGCPKFWEVSCQRPRKCVIPSHCRTNFSRISALGDPPPPQKRHMHAADKRARERARASERARKRERERTRARERERLTFENFCLVDPPTRHMHLFALSVGVGRLCFIYDYT